MCAQQGQVVITQQIFSAYLKVQQRIFNWLHLLDRFHPCDFVIQSDLYIFNIDHSQIVWLEVNSDVLAQGLNFLILTFYSAHSHFYS